MELLIFAPLLLGNRLVLATPYPDAVGNQYFYVPADRSLSISCPSVGDSCVWYEEQIEAIAVSGGIAAFDSGTPGGPDSLWTVVDPAVEMLTVKSICETDMDCLVNCVDSCTVEGAHSSAITDYGSYNVNCTFDRLMALECPLDDFCTENYVDPTDYEELKGVECGGDFASEWYVTIFNADWCYDDINPMYDYDGFPAKLE